jgi:hypothetical protein
VQTQAAFRDLQLFCLLDHGDAREKTMWPSVSNRLSGYEQFWRTFIILLTNRIDPSRDCHEHAWIRLRDCVPRQYEDIAMSNYSVFYYAAAALEQMEINCSHVALGKYPHPELVFFQLQTCVENAKRLQSTARTLLASLKVTCRIPKHPEACYQTIGAYRNAFSHDPVLGRAATHGRELIPPEGILPNRSNKNNFLRWSDTDKISIRELVDCLECQRQLWNQLTIFFQKMWEALSECFLRARIEDKFIQDLSLSTLLPIRFTMGMLSTMSPFSASGTIIK